MTAPDTGRSKLFERDLADPVKAFLKAEGWDLFEEVPHAGKVPDIVGVWSLFGGDRLGVFELKTSLGYPVQAQALFWCDHAHSTSIVVPWAKMTPERQLALDVCAWKGIGVLEVRKLEKTEEAALARGVEPKTPRVVWLHDARNCTPKDDGAGLREALAPQHQGGAYAGAGTKTGTAEAPRWTLTERRREAVRAYLATAGDVAPFDVVAAHVGCGDTRAPRSLLLKWAQAGEISRVRLNGCETVLRLELVEPGEERPLYSERSLRTAPRR